MVVGSSFDLFLINEDTLKQEYTKCFTTTQKWLQPWPVGLSWLSIITQSERLPLRFPVRAQAWVVGPASGWGVCVRSNWSMFLSHINVSLPLFLPPLPSLKINKWSLKKNTEWRQGVGYFCFSVSNLFFEIRLLWDTPLTLWEDSSKTPQHKAHLTLNF